VIDIRVIVVVDGTAGGVGVFCRGEGHGGRCMQSGGSGADGVTVHRDKERHEDRQGQQGDHPTGGSEQRHEGTAGRRIHEVSLYHRESARVEGKSVIRQPERLTWQRRLHNHLSLLMKTDKRRKGVTFPSRRFRPGTPARK